MAVILAALAWSPSQLNAIGVEAFKVGQPVIAPESTTTTTTQIDPLDEMVQLIEPQLVRLRWCESTDNYEAVDASRMYRGAYQFDRSTWNGVAERWAPNLVGQDPAQAEPGHQDRMAAALHSERGWQPWPHCGRGLP